MEENKNEIESSKEKEAFKNLKVDYSKSKEDIWAQMETTIDSKASVAEAPKVVKMKFMKWSIAAVLLALISFGMFAKLYTIDVEVAKGEFAEHTLPDGSIVYLNAESSLSYQPYWWTFERSVELKGEAFFEVQKGEKFAVESSHGKTEVLGTSFNIYSRDDNYSVFCSTGKVKVSDNSGSSVLLTPGNFAELKENNISLSESSENEILSWRLNKFIYNTTSLDKVFGDLERQYDISIDAKKQIRSKVYTGVFERDISIEDALRIICLSFDLSFEEESSKTYRVH
ncbi:MAG: transmembrane sensor [Arenicella sp.]|jgi:transmembrane sensor